MKNDDGWLRQVFYLVVTDRFANGDPTNDRLGAPDCFDPSNPYRFHGGDLAGVREHIPYLSDLGATAIWTTPLYAQVPLRDSSCGYHGYWADFTDPDDGALEPKLGSWDDVSALTSALHAAGMRFVMDMVVNHAGRGARIARERPTWLHDEATCASRGDPVVECPLHGLPDFAQEQPVVADYLTGLSRRWVSRVKPDGIRLDTAKHMPPGYLATSWVPGVRSASARELFLVAEVFDTDSIAHVLPELDAGFDSAFHFPLQHALSVAFAQGGSVNAVADVVASTLGTLGQDRALRLVTMLDNHDMPRFMTPVSGLSPAERDRRYAVALTALFTLPGIPQIYQGDELGMIGAYPDNRRDMPAWAWSAATRSDARVHDGTFGDAQASWSLVKKLAALRSSEDALWRGGYEELARQTTGGANALVFTRRSAAGSVLVVLGNDDAPRELVVSLVSRAPRPAWSDGTTLEELVGAGATPHVTIDRGRVAIVLPPRTAAIYRANPAPQESGGHAARLSLDTLPRSP